MPTGSYIRTEEHREAIKKRALERGYGKWMIGRTKEKCHNWKGGLPNCVDCGKELSYRKGTRCRKCADKFYVGEKSHLYGLDRKNEKCPRWIDGRSKKPDYKANLSRKKYHTDEAFRLRKRASNWKRYTKGKLSLKIIQMIYEDNIKKYGTLTCYLCCRPIPFGKDHIEHKTPLSRDGTNEYNNLAIACQSCNCKKNNKTEEEFNGFYLQ